MSPRRHAKPSQPSPDDDPHGLDRLQKVLAAAGIGSRRECEELIAAGRVEVDGEFVTEMGRKVDPTVHKIQVDGVVLAQPKRVYYALNKPVGVVSTNSDPDGRPRVIDLIKSIERLYPVGRLDRTSEGLILVTNDGELANRLTHPRYGVEKVYRVRVVGKPTAEELAKVRKGVYLSDGLARVSSIETKRRFKQSTELEIVLQEGLNREVRRILARIGHKVVQLKRVAIGPIRLGTMPVGAHRMLSHDEVQALRRATKRRKRTDGESQPAAKEQRVRPSSQPTRTGRPATTGTPPTGGRPATSSAFTPNAGSAATQPRRRKTGSSALSGYTRPTKRGGKGKKTSTDFQSASKKRESAAQVGRSAKPVSRPKKKTAKTSVRPGKPIATKKRSGRPGKGPGKPSAAFGKKKSARKRRP